MKAFLVLRFLPITFVTKIYRINEAGNKNFYLLLKKLFLIKIVQVRSFSIKFTGIFHRPYSCTNFSFIQNPTNP